LIFRLDFRRILTYLFLLPTKNKIFKGGKHIDFCGKKRYRKKKRIPPECPATVAEAAGFVCSGPKRRDRPADIFHSTLSANIQTTKKTTRQTFV